MQLAKIIEEADLPTGYRNWTGNSASYRNHHGDLPDTATPLFMRLSWKRDGSAPAQVVACLRLDLDGLLKGGYVRQESPGHIRLRFVHEENGNVCIQINNKGPALVVGSVR